MNGPLTAMQPARTRLFGIEAARGIAALMVVFYHAARHLQKVNGSMPWGGVAQFGHAGVDFFFVLSGFIILFVHRKDVGSPGRLSHYAERRFTRVYPLFWIALAMWTVLASLSHSGDAFSPAQVLSQATLLFGTGDVGVAWTLRHEILFYLVFAIAILQRRIGVALFIIWFLAVTIGWLAGYAPENPALHILLSTFNLEFLFGMAAAHAVTTWSIRRPGLLLGCGVVLFLGFGLCENLGLVDGYASRAQIVYGMGSMLVVMGLVSKESAGTLRVPAMMRHLGAASYAIYLFHLPIIGIAYKVLAVSGLQGRLPVALIYGLLVVSGVVGGVLVSKMVEYPLMKITGRFFNRYRGTSTASIRQSS
jgi:peptidoglycan/LPS O-acetylase OafA/YrhL